MDEQTALMVDADGAAPAGEAGAGPADASTDHRHLTGVAVLGLGVLGMVALRFAASFLASGPAGYAAVTVLAALAFLGAAVVAGRLQRHRDLGPAGSGVAAVLVVLAGVPLVVPDVAVLVARDWAGGGVSTWFADHATWTLTASFVLLSAAWLVVRRVTGPALLVLPVLAVAEYAWLAYGVAALFPVTGGDPWATEHLAWPVYLGVAAVVLAFGSWLADHRDDVDAAADADADDDTDTGDDTAGPARAVGVPAPRRGSEPVAHGDQPAPTSLLALVALALGLAGVAVGGIVFGHLALARIRRTREEGRGMAVAAVVIGYAWITLAVLVLAALAAARTQT